MLKRILTNLELTIILLLKFITYFLVFSCFFLIFSRLASLRHLLTISRTTAVTLLTFFVVGTAMLKIYGSYDIGKKKSKPIIYSLAIAIFITDIITYIMLCIMNTNPNFNPVFEFTGWYLLFPIFFLQLLILIVMTYLGNYVYFSIHAPDRVLIVIDQSKNNSTPHLYSSLKRFKKQYNVTNIIDYQELTNELIQSNDTVILSNLSADVRKNITETCYHEMKTIIFTPDIADIVEQTAERIMLDDTLMFCSEVKTLRLEQRIMKRFMDITISLIGIILSSPIWIICSILIYREDHGPIFFKQKRLTMNGKVFEVFKFRTMRVDAEHRSASENDDRITKIGKFIRRIRMDELPQLFNILIGDMSVVGPRPEMIENFSSYVKELPEFNYRLRMKAGLTGYAQIEGKYNTSPKDKLILDLMYIENYSFWTDIKLIFQTVTVFFKKDSTEGF